MSTRTTELPELRPIAQPPGQHDGADEHAHPSGERERALQRPDARRRLVPDERMDELQRTRPGVPSQSSSGTPVSSSHQELESAARATSPIAFTIAWGRPPRRDRVLEALRVSEAEGPADDQAERQQPQEEPVGDATGEDARRDTPVALDRTEGNRDRRVLLGGAPRFSAPAAIVPRTRPRFPAGGGVRLSTAAWFPSRSRSGPHRPQRLPSLLDAVALRSVSPSADTCWRRSWGSAWSRTGPTRTVLPSSRVRAMPSKTTPMLSLQLAFRQPPDSRE